MKYACPCCNYLTYDEEPNGSFEICPVCYWEDDAVQNNNPVYSNGANNISLNDAKKNFKEFGAIKFEYKKNVRKPFRYEIHDLLIEQITLTQLADILQWCGLKTVEDITQIILSVIISNNEWDEYNKLFENIKQSVSDDKLKDTMLPDELVSNILDALGMIVFYRKDSNSLSSLSYEPNEHNLRLTNQWSEFIRINGFDSVKKYNHENETILKTSDALFKYGFKIINKVYERTLVEL